MSTAGIDFKLGPLAELYAAHGARRRRAQTVLRGTSLKSNASGPHYGYYKC
jgi:hypothetical protein